MLADKAGSVTLDSTTHSPILNTATPGNVPIANGQTPETYLGSSRAAGFQGSYPGDGMQTLQLPPRLDLNHWGLGGTWDVSSEYITAAQPGAMLTLSFRARDVYLVMSTAGSATAHVTLGGTTAASSAGTEDVSASGEVTVSSARLYHLVHLPESAQATVTITFDTPGVQAFAFTFGS
jgi:hypothetical protein